MSFWLSGVNVNEFIGFCGNYWMGVIFFVLLFLLMYFLFRVFLIVVLLTGCKVENKPHSDEIQHAPNSIQWFNLNQIDQLIEEPNYYQPLILNEKILDSLQIKLFSVHAILNNDQGYRFERKLDFHYSGNLKKMLEELFYNRKSIHKRKFVYNYRNNNTYAAPIVTNETRKINTLIRQFFGLGADAVEMVGLTDVYIPINDSLIIAKHISNPSIIREIYERTISNPLPDSLNYGVMFYQGTPFCWRKKSIFTPFFGWIVTHELEKDSSTNQPLKKIILKDGHTIKRTYLYQEDGLFSGLIDSVFHSDLYIRKQLLSISYDSISFPENASLSFQNLNGDTIETKSHRFIWK